MSEIVPGVSAFAVVLAYGSPLPLAEIGPPLLPGDVLLADCVESVVFACHGIPAIVQKGRPSMSL